MRKYNINILENPDTSLNKGRNFSKTEKSAMLKKKKSQRAKKEKFTMNEKLLRQMLRYNPQSKVSYLCSIAKNLGFLGSWAGKQPAYNARDPGLISGSGRSHGKRIGNPLQYSWASLMAQTIKKLPAIWETWVWTWIGKIPWRRAWQPTPVFLPGQSPMDRGA